MIENYFLLFLFVFAATTGFSQKKDAKKAAPVAKKKTPAKKAAPAAKKVAPAKKPAAPKKEEDW